MHDCDQPLARMLQLQTCSGCPRAMVRLCDLKGDEVITLLCCSTEQPACMQLRVRQAANQEDEARKVLCARCKEPYDVHGNE